MTKSDIADIIREEISIDKKDILFVIDRFVEEIISAADRGETLRFADSGLFPENLQGEKNFFTDSKKS